MYLCLLGIGIAPFCDFSMDFGTVPRVWYFGTVPRVWYFVTVPRVWYFCFSLYQYFIEYHQVYTYTYVQYG